MSYIRRPEPPRGFPPATLRLARSLGWLSLGFGAVELLAPAATARFIGLRGAAPLIASYGGRELLAAAGTLTQPDPTPWIWSRVGGDALDLVTLAAAFAGRGGRRTGPVLALLAVATVTALDVACARSLTQARRQPQTPMRDYSDRSGFPHGHPRLARS